VKRGKGAFARRETGLASRVALVGAIVGVVSLLLLAAWLAGDSTSGTSAGADHGGKPDSQRPDGRSARVGMEVRARPTAGANGQRIVEGGPDGFPFLADVRSLAMSKDPAKVDFALLTAPINCLVLAYPESVVRDRQSVVRELAALGLPGFARGAASDIAGARVKATERCRMYFPAGGNSLSDDERAAVRRANSGPYARVLEVRRILGEGDASAPEFQEALAEALSGPLFSSIRTLLSDRWDFGALAAGYPESMREPMQVLAIDLLLCRFGNDCGADGIVTTQMCWHSGVCGGDFESAVLRNLAEQQIDPSALIRFVTVTYERLQRRQVAGFLRK